MEALTKGDKVISQWDCLSQVGIKSNRWVSNLAGEYQIISAGCRPIKTFFEAHLWDNYPYLNLKVTNQKRRLVPREHVIYLLVMHVLILSSHLMQWVILIIYITRVIWSCHKDDMICDNHMETRSLKRF
jgi:hypothetical protein